MNVGGVGIDIVEIERFKHSVERRGRKLLEKIFTDEELKYCLSMKNPYPHLAGRFCAKEAVLKSLGLGIGCGVRLRDVEIYLDKSGKPNVRMKRIPGWLIEKLGRFNIHISLSHSGNYAIATAILITE